MAHKIVIAGGTGFLGQAVVNFFTQKQDVELIVLTRKNSFKKNAVSYIQWDAKTAGPWIDALEGSTAVINLVGKSVNCRYTTKNKEEIIASRVNATTAIGNAIATLVNPPGVWINAGSAAIYGNSGDEVKDEYSATGDGFSADVCKQWEAAFFEKELASTRKVVLRMGLVFQKGTGLLQPFAKLVKFGFGGKFGNGNQYISWIHEVDFLNVLYTVLVSDEYRGVINCTSPQPVTNKDFMKGLRKALNKSFGLPNPAVILKLGALFIGTEAELVLSGRRVVSKILEENNFKFQQPGIENALQHLLSAS